MFSIKKSTIGDLLNKSVERAMGATSQSEKYDGKMFFLNISFFLDKIFFQFMVVLV